MISSSLVEPSSFRFRLAEIAEEYHRVEREKLSLEEDYKEVVLLDAQRRCRSFAMMFTNKLPIELRDMVYSYVWCAHSPLDDEYHLDALDNIRREYDVNRDVKDDAPWLLSCKGDSCQCFFWWDLPLWVQPAFVGHQVAKEAAAAYYRTMAQHWTSDLDVQDMNSFMLHDRFHLGVRPADHLRQLQFWIESTEKNELGDWLEGHISRECLPDLEDYLRPLLEIRVKKGFTLVIRWSDQNMESGHKLEALRFIVRPLRDAGAHVKVMSFVYGMQDCHDVSDFYEMSWLEWHSKWQRAAFVEQIERAEPGTSVTSSEESSDLEDDETESVLSSGSEHESEVSDDYGAWDHGSEDAIDTMTIGTPPDTVIHMLAERAQADPALKDLMRVVAAGEASREQLQTFQEHMEALTVKTEAGESS